MTRRLSALRAFLASAAAGGVALLAATLLALLLANLPATAAGYDAFVEHRLGLMSIHRWVNDGAMAVFFLLVGLEIKREIVGGQLARPERRRLPVLTAIAGMAVPAVVFLLVAGAEPTLQPGWAIPAATDIAFAIGILALLGSRVPPALKLLLTTVAIVDDMGAVAIIAIGYTSAIAPLALAGALAATGVLYVLNRRGVTVLWPYLAVGAVLWLFVLRSGVHATVAGIVVAAMVPTGRREDASPLGRLEHALEPWVAFLIVPLFALVNAGVSLHGFGPATLATPLVLGIALGLFLGKQAGIAGAIWAADRLGIARKPQGVSWGQLYGMALIAGVGFTMSLFIGALAFPGDATRMTDVKIGVLVGSLVSALAGTAVLLATTPRRPA